MPLNLIVRLLPPLISGALFGAGLTIGGMTDPRRVRNFLDVFGDWDPTLIFVMAGALAVMAIAWPVRRRLSRPFFGERFSLPERGDLDPKLVIGAACFGIGWGIAGLCPGPSVSALALAPFEVLPFVVAMLAGMALHRLMPTHR